MIWLLLLIELLHETFKGDKHDFLSLFRLAFMFFLAVFWGIAKDNYLEGIYYVMARFAIFDISIALLRGHVWHYLGNTSKYDLFLKRFNKYALLSIRVICLLIVLIYE